MGKMIVQLILLNHLGIFKKKQRPATSQLAFACVLSSCYPSSGDSGWELGSCLKCVIME